MGARVVRVVASACHLSLCRARIDVWLGYLQVSGEASPITINFDQNENNWVTSTSVTPPRVSVDSISLLRYQRIVLRGVRGTFGTSTFIIIVLQVGFLPHSKTSLQ